MARRIEEKLIDDVDGSDAEFTEFFSVGNRRYKIDMGEISNKKFWENFNYWTKYAQEVPAVEMRSGLMVNSAKCRAYAKSIGIPIRDQGTPNRQAQKAYAIAYLDGTLPAKFR